VGRPVPQLRGPRFEQATSGDEVFRQLVLARIVEPASKLGSLRVLDLRRRFSDVTPTAKSLVKRLLQRIGKTGQVRTDPKFKVRGVRTSASCAASSGACPGRGRRVFGRLRGRGWVGELLRTYGIHRTTVSAHIARTGKTRPCGRVAAETLDS